MKLIFRTLSAALLLCMIAPSLSVFASESETEASAAVEYTGDLAIGLSDRNSEKLKDQSFRTKVEFSEAKELTLTSEHGIYSLYIVWDQIPGEWTLKADETEYLCGKQGFIHEFIRLGGEKELTVNIPRGAIVCDIRAFGEGTVPGDVQIWNEPCEKADLLLIPSHADDEHLYFGGTMPYYAGELGLAVQVAYFTNHWKEPRRPHEMLNGLWTVGVTNYPVISPYEDKATFSLESAKEIYDEEEMLGYIVYLMRRFRPSVVIGHDLKGEYGHGAHMLSAELICRAVDGVVQDPSMYPESAEEFGAYDVPKTYIHKYEENIIYMDWDKPLERFDGKTAFEMAKEGYACHVSQHGFDIAVTKYGTASCIWFGLYRSTVGPDTLEDPDFLENIPEETEPETTAPETTEPETTEPVTAAPETTEETETETEESEASPSASESESVTAEQSPSQSTSEGEKEPDKEKKDRGNIPALIALSALALIIPAVFIISAIKNKKGTVKKK